MSRRRWMIRAAAALLVTAAVGLGSAAPARACSVCFGDPDHPMTQGANMAIFVMLGVVGFVLAGFFLFILYIARRAKKHGPLAPSGKAGPPGGVCNRGVINHG